jgi:hypothetical protein
VILKDADISPLPDGKKSLHIHVKKFSDYRAVIKSNFMLLPRFNAEF